MRIIQTNHQCAKFLNNPIDAPRITFLGLKFSFPIHKFQTWKLAQKILTDMRDSKSWTEILIFNHHYHTQINRRRDRIIRMQQLTYKSFSSFFFFIFSSSTLHCFLLFCSFRAGRSSYSCLFVLVFSFYFFSIPAFFSVPFVDVAL